LCRISQTSTMDVSGGRLRLSKSLEDLPLPVFDPDLQTTTVVPFVFLTPPDTKTLSAAGMVASWLGVLSSTKPVRFSVTVGNIPPGNAVVFANSRSALPAVLQLPGGSGALLALRDNPSDEL